MIHIVIEGLDGTGKSTLVTALFDKMCLDPDFHSWIYKTKEPGNDMEVSPGLPIKRPGINIRNIVLNETSLTPFERELLFYIDASQHRRFIKDQGKAIVISDRGLWSHLAYLRGCLKTNQLDYSEYILCKDLISEMCPIPDKVIYLRGNIDLMKSRNSGKTKDIIESNKDEYFSYVLETYEDLAFENKNCLILDATNSTSTNVDLVLKFLKEEFTHEELKSGTRELH